jgi:hypothetical protein
VQRPNRIIVWAAIYQLGFQGFNRRDRCPTLRKNWSRALPTALKSSASAGGCVEFDGSRPEAAERRAGCSIHSALSHRMRAERASKKEEQITAADSAFSSDRFLSIHR